jgi:hypothetical protein
MTHYPHRCDVCGRHPEKTHADFCEKVARAVARLADNLGYEETAREMRELYEVNTEEANDRTSPV